EALRLAYDTHNALGIEMNVLSMAWVYIMNNQPHQAGELLGLMQSQPQLNSDLHTDLRQIMFALREIISEDDLSASLDRGKLLNLDDVAQRLLAEFS
ncbi:MAG TPA: hypothetical protein PLZ51_16765, partial [Aggregatilineales bacterium]|nr:hypothetical protein [Aggregatilineales bacterium]